MPTALLAGRAICLFRCCMNDPAHVLALFGVNALWTDSQRQVRDTVRRFARESYGHVVADCYESERFPTELIPKLGAMGLLGANLSGHGCAGMDATSYGLALSELEYVDSGLRSFCSVQGALCMYPIDAFGDEAQRERWLESMAKGETIGCFGLTEPDSGSDPGAMSTTAVRGDGGWVLNGRKMWITNAPIADLVLVWAKVGDERHQSIRGFLVERGSAGLTTPTMKGKLSLRASLTGEVVLDDCFVPDTHVLEGVEGLKGPLSCLTQARFGIVWGVLGAALCCFETALDYTRQREQFGRPLASFQLSQQKLANMAADIVAGHLLAKHLSDLKDDGKLTPTQVSLGKRENVRRALETARTARSMLGANGIMGDYPIMRHAANLETVFTYEGTHEIHTLSLGRALTGLSAFQG